jgi:hypothetical protein
MLAGCQIRPLPTSTPLPEAAESVSERPVVSIVKIERGKIEPALCETSAEYLERYPVGLGCTATALNRLDEAWMARSQSRHGRAGGLGRLEYLLRRKAWKWQA